MTVAVCLKCGAMKHGAFNRCPKCKYEPQDAEDKAKHTMASDHFLSQPQLEEIATSVKNGEALDFNKDQVAQFVMIMDTAKSSTRINLETLGVLCVSAIVALALAYFLALLKNW